MNHGSDGYAFIQAMPKERIRYLHIAGHEQISENLLIDTHEQKSVILFGNYCNTRIKFAE
jgi:uncharacterized protein (UPF0276 family)